MTVAEGREPHPYTSVISVVSPRRNARFASAAAAAMLARIK